MARWVRCMTGAGELFEGVMSVVDMGALMVEGACKVPVSFDVQVIASLVVVVGVAGWDLFAQGASDGGARDS